MFCDVVLQLVGTERFDAAIIVGAVIGNPVVCVCVCVEGKGEGDMVFRTCYASERYRLR